MSMIGPGGKLIQSIMTECGDVNIRFPSEDAKSDVIVIRGTKDDVEKAEVFLNPMRKWASCVFKIYNVCFEARTLD